MGGWRRTRSRCAPCKQANGSVCPRNPRNPHETPHLDIKDAAKACFEILTRPRRSSCTALMPFLKPSALALYKAFGSIVFPDFSRTCFSNSAVRRLSEAGSFFTASVLIVAKRGTFRKRTTSYVRADAEV